MVIMRVFTLEVQGCLTIQKSINIIHHINRIKPQINIMITIGSEKKLDYIQSLFMISLGKVRTG